MPSLTLSDDSPAVDLATELQARTDLLRRQLLQAQNRMKLKADKIALNTPFLLEIQCSSSSSHIHNLQ